MGFRFNEKKRREKGKMIIGAIFIFWSCGLFVMIFLIIYLVEIWIGIIDV